MAIVHRSAMEVPWSADSGTQIVDIGLGTRLNRSMVSRYIHWFENLYYRRTLTI